MIKFRNVLAGVMVLAMVLVAAPSAQGQTVAELSALVAQLQAQLAALQGGSTSSAGCYAFTRNLTIGSQGADVTALQAFLQGTGHFTFSGGATGYFGPITQTAVAAWQASNGVSPAAGYFGPISMARYQQVCTPTAPTTPGDGDGDGDGDLSGGEADIRNYDVLNEFDNEDLAEGETGTVFGFEFDVEDADVSFQRLELVFEADPSGSQNEQPWRYIEEVCLMMDGDEVECVDADSSSDWSDDTNTSDGNGSGLEEYEITMSGLSEILRDGDTPQFEVEVRIQDNIDSSDADMAFNVFVRDDGARARDGEGINHEFGEGSDYTTFTVEELSTDAELTVRQSADDPDAATLEVDADNKSDEFVVGVFEMEAEDAPMVFDEIVYTLTFTGSPASYNAIVANTWIEIDGTKFADETVATPTASSSVVTIDLDGDFEMDTDEEVDVEVIVEFKKQSGNYAEGAQVQATVTGTNVDAFDVETSNGDTLDSTQLSGSYTGDTHTLRTEGISISANASDHDTTRVENDDTTTADNEGIFTIVFEVSAFGADFYVPFGASTTFGTPDFDGAIFSIRNPSNTVITTGTTTGDLDSTADIEDGAFIVREGDTEDFTLTVVYDPATAGFYRTQLENVRFRDLGAADSTGVAHSATPAQNFRTSTLNI